MSAEEVTRLRQEVSALQQQAKGANAGEPIYLGQYLLERLAQLGVTVSCYSISAILNGCLIFILANVWCSWRFQPW